MDEISGDGGECGSEIEQYARSILMHKGSMHGGGVHIQQVLEDGAATQEALLSFGKTHLSNVASQANRAELATILLSVLTMLSGLLLAG